MIDFSSPTLGHELWSKQTKLRGTVLSSRKGMPKVLSMSKGKKTICGLPLARGESLSFQHKDFPQMHVSCWMDKQAVTVLSTGADLSTTSVSRCVDKTDNRADLSCPSAISRYN